MAVRGRGPRPGDGHVVHVRRRDAREVQRRPDCLYGERGILFLAADSLFGGGKNQFAVADQAGRRLVHAITDSKDVHFTFSNFLEILAFLRVW